MQYSLSQIFIAVAVVSIPFAAFAICQLQPVWSVWIVVPMVYSALIVVARVSNHGTNAKPTPHGNAAAIAFCTWAFVFVLAVEHGDIAGGNGPIQYAQSPASYRVFQLRMLVVIGLFLLPVISVLVNLFMAVFKIPINAGYSILALTTWIVAIVTLFTHIHFIPMA